MKLERKEAISIKLLLPHFDPTSQQTTPKKQPKPCCTISQISIHLYSNYCLETENVVVNIF